ncbi:MAG: 4-coumarate--CoA ligase [Pseudomonadota bacterium]
MGDPKQNPLIGACHMRRLLFALIDDHQATLMRKGALPESARLSVQAPELNRLDDMVIGEEALGLDSLARIELVQSLTARFGLDATGVEDYFLVQRRFGDWVDLLMWHLEQMGDRAALGFFTSGSTGAPKHIEHRALDLLSEIDALISGPLADWPAGGRILSLVPPHHIYGFLWSVLLPSRTGRTVIDLPPGMPGPVLRTAKPGDLIVATPFLWDAMGRLTRRLAADVTGVTSGAPSTQATWQAAEHVGLSRLIEIYGASETGGVGWRTGAEAAFVLASDIARDGAEVYRRSNMATALPVQDHLDWDGADTFRITGRKDTVVQVAGTNVNLSDLRHQILSATAAQDAALRLDGLRLKAFIAVAPAMKDQAEAAFHRFAATLPAPARPARVDWGTSLPTSPHGKAADW